MTITTRRRFQALLMMAVLTMSLFGRLPGAPEAGAAVHNLFPADVDGFPKGRFKADEALFVNLTSDFYGGAVCVVDASVTDPTTVDCLSPRWGEANQYVAIGTLIGVPFEKPMLRPGKWKLLATATTGKNGNELSEPFEVVSCTPTCDTSVATAQLLPWKARAKLQVPTEEQKKRALAVDIATRTYKIASAMYTGMSFGLAGAMLGGAWAAANFDFVVPSTEDLAKALHKKLSATVSQMWAGIDDDPPDANYGTVAAPEFSTLDATGDVLLDEYFDVLMRAEAYGTASRIANERYQGAEIDADHRAAATQAEASAEFTYDLIAQLRRLKVLQPQVAALGWANESIVAAPDGEDPPVWWADMVAQLDDLKTSGLSATDRQFLLDHGITAPQIDEAVAQWSDPDWVADMRAIDPTATIADALNADTALLGDTIKTYDKFGRWMSLNAVDEEALAPATPVNQAPVSAFDATALTGVAPLKVTFTSKATDPDGDALSLRWDIAGDRIVEDATSVTHTFDTPGSYGVSLVATDPDGEWDQAIKWITVYPDETGPVTNNPPVAQFSPQMVDKDGPITQTFTSSSFDPDGDALTHTWYFGDGTTQTGESVTKTFPAGFVMSVLLVVSDGELTGQASGEVTSRDPGVPDPGNPPVVAFTATPSSGLSPLEVSFESTSFDPDGDALTHTWYFGDGDTGTGETATHTYTAAGTYTAALVVSDGTHSRSATKTIVVDATTPVKAAFGIGQGYDAAAAVNGARMLDTGVSDRSSYWVSNLIDPTNSGWYSANGVTTEQEIIVRLAGDGRDLIDRLVLQSANATTGVKTFSVALSQGTNPFGTYTTVIDHGTLAQDASEQPFPFARQTARYLKLTVHDNHGGNYLRLTKLSTPTVGRDGGVVSMSAGTPATIVSASSSENTASYVLTPDNNRWIPTRVKVADQRIRVRLGGDGPQRIGTVMLRTFGASSSAVDAEVYASMTGDDGDWTKVLDAALPGGTTTQSFPIGSLPEARFVEVRFVNPDAAVNFPPLYLAEMRVVTPEGLNVADGRAVGAQIVDYSKQDNGVAENAIAPDSTTGSWGTTGGSTDQFLTVLLRNGEIATIDRVSLRAPNYRAKTVRIEVSTDGVTFTTVAKRTLLNNAAEQFISFPAVEARYVKLFVEDGYHATHLQVSKFRVFSADRGGGTDVPFVDQSTGTVAIEHWHWDFGDGTTSTEQHPLHTFPGPGTYPITLIVTDADDVSDTVTGSYMVPGLPSISVTTNAEEQLDGTAATDEGKNVDLVAATDGTPAVAWEWDLDYIQPTTSTATIRAKFPDQGAYTVRYRALTADWLWTPWASKTFTVRNVAPTVNAGLPQTGYADNEIIPLVATVSDPADLTRLSCTWDWGDGTALQTIALCNSTTKARVPHTYAAAGVYAATITADDGDGGVTSSTVAITALHRPAVLQVTAVTPTVSDLKVTVRLLDGLDGGSLGGLDLSIGASGSTPIAATGDAEGFVTVTIPDASAATEVTAVFGGTTRNASRSLTRKVRVPTADIVFLIDESGSMAGNQAAIISNLQTIVSGLTSSLDFRVGTVGYAAGVARGFGRVHSPLNSDMPEIYAGLRKLVISSSNANGFEAMVVGSGYRFEDGELVETSEIDQRPPAASCAVLVTDAAVSEAYGLINSKNPVNPLADYDAALQALQSRGTTLFSITTTDQATRDAYGLGTGLAGQTGGDNWSISDFVRDPSGVLEALTTKCVTKAQTPDLAVALEGPDSPVAPGDEITYKVTATNAAAIDTPWVTLAATLPADVEFMLAAGGGTYDPATRKVTWPTFDLNAGEDLTRNITARVRASDWDAGDHALTASATVEYNGSLGSESNTDNNHATHAGTVHVAEPIGPSTTTTTTTTTTLPDPGPATTTTTLPDPGPTTTTTLPDPGPTTTTLPDPGPTTTLPKAPPTTTTPEPMMPEPPGSPVPSDAVASPMPNAVLGDQRSEATHRVPGPDGVPLARTGPTIPVPLGIAVGIWLALLGALLVRRARPSARRR